MTRAALLIEAARAERAARETLHALTLHVAALGVDAQVTQEAQRSYFMAYKAARKMRALVSANFPG